MRRKTKIGSLTIHNGDVLKVLPTLKDETVVLLITDPPYSSGGQSSSARKQSTATKYCQDGESKFADFLGDNRDQRSYLVWSTMWLMEAWRTLKPGGLFCIFVDWRQYPVLTDAIQAANLVWRGAAVWDKSGGSRPQKGRFRAQSEFVLWGSKGPWPTVVKDAPVLPGVFQCSPQKGPKLHQVGKPENVMDWLLQLAPPGSHVLDPFMGSGTTLVAAQRRGCRATGIEMSEHYFDVCKERLKGLEKAS